jgi:hypothetical protein
MTFTQTNESWYLECQFRHLDDAAKQLDFELTACTLTQDQWAQLDLIIGRLIKIAATRKPRETADAV